MDKWEIRPARNDDDPDRHLLLLRGGPADVAALIKKFGALFGRPTPCREGDYNFSLVLHRFNSSARERLEEWLNRDSSRPTSAVAAASESAPTSAAPPGSVPEIVLRPPQGEPASFAAPTPLPPLIGEPPSVPQPRSPEPEIPPLIPLAAEPIPGPAPVPEPAPAAPFIPELAPVSSVAAPSEPSAAVEPVPPPLPVQTAPAVEPPPAAESVAPPSASGQEDGVHLREYWTMETLLVGAYDRFAHAAATQVVSSPGTMYNPLFLYGVPGTGKSHFLHALAHALSKGLGGTGLWVTSGPQLGRGADAALAAKDAARLEKRAAQAQALLVDDIHLMSVSDRNKDLLAKVFKSFFDRKLQVVITSGYPPRALGALEEALRFSFSKGWSVDLKVPSPTAQKDLISAAAEHTGVHFAAEELALIHEKLQQWGYQEMSLWLARLAAFKKLREAAGQSAAVVDLMPLMYDPILAGGGEAPQAGAPFRPPPVAPGASPLAVVVPKDQMGLSAYVAGRFHETATKFGVPASYRHSLWESYDAQQPFGAPFMIGEACERGGATHVLVLGPSPESALGPRSAEFAHHVRRILESRGMKTGWVPLSGASIAAHYLNAHLDFISATGA